jgi:predicted transcriptional regulator
MKIPTKVFLPGDTIQKLDVLSRRTRRGKSEIARAAIEAYLSPDSAEASEAAMGRRLDRLSRQLDRLERDVTITTEAVALFVKTWLKVTPAMSSEEDRAAAAKGQERYAAFVDLLARRLADGRLLKREVLSDAPDDRVCIVGTGRISGRGANVRNRRSAVTPGKRARRWTIILPWPAAHHRGHLARRPGFRAARSGEPSRCSAPTRLWSVSALNARPDQASAAVMAHTTSCRRSLPRERLSRIFWTICRCSSVR